MAKYGHLAKYGSSLYTINFLFELSEKTSVVSRSSQTIYRIKRWTD